MDATSPPSVVTLTLNPSLDVSYEVDHLIDDRKVHARDYRYDPGGNGINVARGLHRLGVETLTCFLSAGEVGSLVERLLAKQVARTRCLRISGETRINVTIEQAQPRAQFEVLGFGPVVEGDALAAFLDEIVTLVGDGYLVLTGSLPPGVPADTYPSLMRRLHERARVIVDMQGPLLASAIAERPFLIKPNRAELEDLVGCKLPTLDDVRRAAAQLHAAGVGRVCVSLGAEGALLADSAGTHHALAPKVDVKSTVGAGDSMVAGLVAAYAAGREGEAALRLGLACGSATAAQPGTEIFDVATVPALAAGIEVNTQD